MFSKKTLERVNIIVSDGDAQEYHQIDIAITTIMSKAERIRCVWHAIERGWQRHGPTIRTCSSSLDELNKTQVLEIINKMKQWMYSWTKSSCETEDEYNISKQLFEKYVFSETVQTITGGDTFSKCVLNFFRNYLEPVLPNMLFYKRKHLRHFDYNTNVKIEGVFRGMKHGCTPVTPQTSLHNSLCILCNAAERRCGEYEKSSTKEVLNTKTWVSLQCGNELNLRGEQLLTAQWKSKDQYDTVRINTTTWLVKYIEPLEVEYKTIYPLFKRIRQVVFEKHVFKCSCQYFERFGIPCCHIYAVMSTLNGYKGPKLRDVSVTYWKQYRLYCYAIETNKEDDRSNHMSNLLKDLRKNDITGPTCSRSLFSDIPMVSEIPSDFYHKGIQCRNYDINELAENNIINVPSGYGLSMSLRDDNCDDSDSSRCTDLIRDHETINNSLDHLFSDASNSSSLNDTVHTTNMKRKAYNILNPVFDHFCIPGFFNLNAMF